MQITTSTIEEIEKIIFEKLSKSVGEPAIISIDGRDGSGKSTLALCLCCRNKNFIYFDIDTHYLLSNDLPYVKSINYELLKKNIENTLSPDDLVVLDGVCNLSIFEKLSLNPIITIYIKELDNSGWWIKGKNFDYNCDLEKIIEERQRISQIPLELEEAVPNVKTEATTNSAETLSDQVIRYHHKYKPDKYADIIYERISVANG